MPQIFMEPQPDLNAKKIEAIRRETNKNVKVGREKTCHMRI